MMQPLDPVSFNAFTRLLARPDPPDLPRRAHVLRCAGDPNRRSTRLPLIFMAWQQRRYLEIEGEVRMIPARRKVSCPEPARRPGLRLLRPTGTG